MNAGQNKAAAREHVVANGGHSGNQAGSIRLQQHGRSTAGADRDLCSYSLAGHHVDRDRQRDHAEGELKPAARKDYHGGPEFIGHRRRGLNGHNRDIAEEYQYRHRKRDTRHHAPEPEGEQIQHGLPPRDQDGRKAKTDGVGGHDQAQEQHAIPHHRGRYSAAAYLVALLANWYIRLLNSYTRPPLGQFAVAGGELERRVCPVQRLTVKERSW